MIEEYDETSLLRTEPKYMFSTVKIIKRNHANAECTYSLTQTVDRGDL